MEFSVCTIVKEGRKGRLHREHLRFGLFKLALSFHARRPFSLPRSKYPAHRAQRPYASSQSNISRSSDSGGSLREGISDGRSADFRRDLSLPGVQQRPRSFEAHLCSKSIPTALTAFKSFWSRCEAPCSAKLEMAPLTSVGNGAISPPGTQTPLKFSHRKPKRNVPQETEHEGQNSDIFISR